jgi:hypothetical protein
MDASIENKDASPTMIDTRGFASRCGFRSFRTHPLALHAEAVAFVRVADCPPKVLEILRQAGLQEFLDRAAGEDVIELGEAVTLSQFVGDQQTGPRRFVPVAEIVRRNRDSVTASEVRAETDKAVEMARQEAREKEAEGLRRMRARHAFEAAAAEAERMKSPAYMARKMAEELEAEKKRLAAETEAKIAAAVQDALAQQAKQVGGNVNQA